MTLYAFVLTVKYAKDRYPVTAISKMCWIAPPFCFQTAFSRFCIVQWIFELSQWWPPSICFDCLFFHVLQTCKRKSSAFVHQILQDIPNPDLENTMPIHQQLWSLECSVVETVASLLRGVTKHCLAGIQSHRPDNVDDIQAVRKSSTKQCNSSDQLLFSAEKWKRY